MNQNEMNDGEEFEDHPPRQWSSHGDASGPTGAMARRENMDSPHDSSFAGPSGDGNTTENGLPSEVVGFARRVRSLTTRVWATPALITICAAIYVYIVVRSGSLSPPLGIMIDMGANFGPKTMTDQWWRLITNAFLHFNLLHLLFNMWVLWSIGRMLERLTGNLGFLLLYFVSAVTGSLASLFWHPGVISAGASGAVFGVCGGLVGFLLPRKDTIPALIRVQLRKDIMFFIVVNVAFGLAVPGIDNAAHLGGLLGGFLMGLLMSQPLDSDTRARRPWRNLMAAGAAIAVIMMAIALLPAPPPDIDKEFAHIFAVEVQVLRAYDNLTTDFDNDKIDPAGFRARLQEEVLVPWRSIREKAEELVDAPLGNRQVLSRIAQSMKLREESWTALAAAMATDEDEQFQKLMATHQEKWDEATKLAREAEDAGTE